MCKILQTNLAIVWDTTLQNPTVSQLAQLQSGLIPSETPDFLRLYTNISYTHSKH